MYNYSFDKQKQEKTTWFVSNLDDRFRIKMNQQQESCENVIVTRLQSQLIRILSIKDLRRNLATLILSILLVSSLTTNRNAFAFAFQVTYAISSGTRSCILPTTVSTSSYPMLQSAIFIFKRRNRCELCINKRLESHRNDSIYDDITDNESSPNASRYPLPVAQAMKSLTSEMKHKSARETTINSNRQSSIPDDSRRRQIIMTMLSAAAASLASDTKTVAYAVDGIIPSDDGKTTKNTLATPDFTNIILPPLDDRDYVTYTLDNGLRVLLCSDPSTNEAAAAMDVHVGACSDPKDIPGMAHFNEHMLFLGTKKFPKENSFESFLTNNGGSSNAYTDSENTVYYFDMTADADNKLAEGLLRFGGFFTEPLFTASATERELNAIESENAKNLQSDTFRSYQLDKSRANKDHPYSKFFTGNKKTLSEIPKSLNINTRDELIKFYNQYYSANQMTLAIVAPQSITKLKQMVTAAFANVPNRNVGRPEETWAGIVPYSADNTIVPSFNYVVEMVPVQDLRQVNIKWPIVYTSDEEKQVSLFVQPDMYVSHLLGHEGQRSLQSYLKKQGWANSVGSSSAEDLSDFESFDIAVGLTPQGLASVNDVVEAIYSYITMLQQTTIPDYIFQEVLQLEELQWRFITKGSPRNYVTSLATSMQKYPPQLYVAGPRRLALDEYATDTQLSRLARSSFPQQSQLDRTKDHVRKYVSNLKVDNAIMTVLSKTFDGQTNLKEKWYGTDYRVRAIETATLNKWKDCTKASKLKIDYPKPNLFIPSESGLRVKNPIPGGIVKGPKTFDERMIPVEPPRIIRDDGAGRWTVYFKEDKQFGKPDGFIVLEVLTKEVFASARNAALANLYELSVADRLNEYSYDAGLAGLIYEVKVLPRGVRLTFGGNNDKLKKFASFLSRKLSREVKDLLPRNDKEFERYKDQIMRILSGFDVKQPYTHASYYGQITLQPRRFQYRNKELREETRKITLPDLVTYVTSLWTSGKGEALIQGNFDEAEALDLVASIGDVLPFQPIAVADYPVRLQALPLPESAAFTPPPRLLVAEPNAANANSVSYVMVQSLGRSEKDHVLIELLNSIVEEPFYNELRTKKQLGYIVASGIRGVESTRTLSFLVQSSIAPSNVLTLEILTFLDNVESTILEKVTKGDFAVFIKSLIERKTEPDKDLATEVTRNWAEIASGRLLFDRRQREARALLDLEKQDLLNFWKSIYSGNGRRVLVTEIIPRQGEASSQLPPTSTGYKFSPSSTYSENDESVILGIDDIDQFRSEREHLVYDQGDRAVPEYYWKAAIPRSNEIEQNTYAAS